VARGRLDLPIVSKFDATGLQKAKDAFGGFGKQLGGIAAGVAAAFSIRAITSFAKESILVAEAAQTAQNRLEAVAKATGVFGAETAKVTDRLADFAKSQEMRIAVDDTVIKGVQAQLLTFKELSRSADETGGVFDRVTIAAFDMAAAGFGSAEGNATALGKAMEDPVKGLTALARNGTVFTDQQKEQIRVLQESGDLLGAQELILAEVESQYGGVAEATADASKRLEIAGKNIKESFGDALLPVFADLVDGLLPVFETIGDVLGETVRDMQPMLQDLAEQIPGLLDAFVPLIPAIASIAGLFIELVAAALPFITKILDVLLPVIGELVPIIMDAVSDAFEPLMEAFMSLVDALLPLVAEFLPIFAEIIAELAPLFADLVAQLAPMIAELLPPLVELFFQLIDALKPMIEQLMPVIVELFQSLVPILITLVTAFLPLVEKILPIVIELIEFLIPILEFVAKLFGEILIGAIELFMDIVAGVQEFMEKFGPILENIFLGLGIVFATVINGIIAGFESFVNFFIRGFNVLVRTVNAVRKELKQSQFALAAEVKFGRVEVPELKPLAVGGIVTGPTAALIGEAGPEAVIPLDRFGDLGGTTQINITVNAGVGTNGTEVGREIVAQIKRYERSSGKVFASA
jgi:phage-related protein